MKRDEVIERFCSLSGKVRNHLSDLGPSVAADCFCDEPRGPFIPNRAAYFCYEHEVLQFIEDATLAAIKLATRPRTKGERE